MGWLGDLFFGGGGKLSAKQLEEKRKMAMLTGEVEAMGDMFTRMQRQCFDKCCAADVVEGRARDDELSLDDERCLERCASKFMQVQTRVGEIFMSEADNMAGAGGAPGQ
mmetsp:Transcript_9201/g.14545  ORF Transcript_9201/g.14545 Transcript_9201/m.14545 type:complete len:109 (+) Transcript_9201:159-485(+)